AGGPRPEDHRAVLAGRGEQLAVRRHRKTVDRAGVSDQGESLGSLEFRLGEDATSSVELRDMLDLAEPFDVQTIHAGQLEEGLPLLHRLARLLEDLDDLAVHRARDLVLAKLQLRLLELLAGFLAILARLLDLVLVALALGEIRLDF